MNASTVGAGAVVRGLGSSWGRIGVALMPAWIALGWLVCRLGTTWSRQPEMQFGWIVVALVAYLGWEALEELPPASFRWTGLNVGVGLAGLGVLFLVQVYRAAFGTGPALLCGHAMAAVLVAGANVHYVFGGAGLRVLAFPLVFLFVAVPLPSFVQHPVTHGLQGLIAGVNVELLNLLGIPAERTGSLIRLSTGVVGVNEACSGIRSLQSSIMATLFIGYLSLRSNVLRGLLFVGGMVTAVVGNVGRSLFLSLSAHARGPGAVEEVHDAAGWSVLGFVVLLVAFQAWYWMRLERRAWGGAQPGS